MTSTLRTIAVRLIVSSFGYGSPDKYFTHVQHLANMPAGLPRTIKHACTLAVKCAGYNLWRKEAFDDAEERYPTYYLSSTIKLMRSTDILLHQLLSAYRKQLFSESSAHHYRMVVGATETIRGINERFGAAFTSRKVAHRLGRSEQHRERF